MVDTMVLEYFENMRYHSW